MVFLDIGSHGGLYAILMAREGVFKDIVAFEPDPVNLAQLHGNLFLNGVTKSVRTLEVAASDAKGQAVFNVAVDSFRGGSRMDEEGDIALSHQITVQTERVDDLIDESGAILVVKIDVEGHEMKVLDGMTQLLGRNSFVMQIESSTPEKLAAVTGFLAQRGIRLERTLHNDHFFISDSLSKA
jgi:FkbM family methyltransferase